MIPNSRSFVRALGVGMLLAATLPLAQTPPPLFKPIPAPPLAKIAAAGEFVKRSSLVAVDWQALAPAGPAAPEAVAGTLNLNLLQDARFIARRTRMQWKAPGRFTWVGRIGDDPVVLSVRDGVMHGMVQAEGRVFEIEGLAGGYQRVLEQDPEQYALNDGEHSDSCGAPEELAEQVAPPEPAPATDASDPVIDVMVLYDKAVSDRIGDMDAYIDNLIEISNESYRISGIPQTVRLVHSRQVASGVTGSQNSWMSQDAEVARLRDAYGADLVAMLIESGLSSCGVARGVYTTTKRSCAVGNKTFTHELGHNMGADHAWEQFTTHNGFAYGYINHQKSWRTVMSYAECDNGGRCTRLLNFSNPDTLYNGSPTGIADSRDNARKMRSRSLAISRYKPTKVGGTVGLEFGSAGESSAGISIRRLSASSLAFNLARGGHLDISIVSLSGRRTPIASRRFDAGDGRAEWKAGQVAPGIHFLHIRGEDFHAVRKISLL